MPPASRRATRSRLCIFFLLICITAGAMLRSFTTFDRFTFVRPNSLAYLQTGSGFLTLGYLAIGGPLQPLGFLHTTSSCPFSLAGFEDETLFMSHFKRYNSGIDGELFGFRLVVSCTDERNLMTVQLPLWAPIAACSLLASAGLLRRAARLLFRRPAPGFAPLAIASTLPSTPAAAAPAENAA